MFQNYCIFLKAAFLNSDSTPFCIFTQIPNKQKIMRVSQDNQPKISLEENVPEGNDPEENVLEENVPEENALKSFEYVQPPESKKSFNSYNILFSL